MANVGKRLLDVIGMMKPGLPIPIIIETDGISTISDVNEIESFGVLVIGQSNIVPVLYARATSMMISKIAEIPFIVSISYDEPVSVTSVPSMLTRGINESETMLIPPNVISEWIRGDEVHSDGFRGEGISIAIIDTGVDLTHPMVSDAVVRSISVIEGEYGDGNGHGTHVAGIAAGRPTMSPKFDTKIYGIAPEASIIAIKVLSDAGLGQTSDIIRGMELAVTLGADIINMSLGSNFDNAGLSSDARMVDTISDRFGIPCVIAAGNSFMNGTIGSPGAARRAITIGSVAMFSPMNNIASTFSSKGPTSDARIKPTLAAYGGNLLPNLKEVIYSSTSGAIAASSGSRYAGLMGTSMACPVVSGAIALLLNAARDAGVELKSGSINRIDYIKNILAYSAKNKHLQDVFSGYGVIDIAKAISMIGTDVPDVTKFNRVANDVLLASKFPSIASSNPLFYERITEVRLPYLT